MKERPDVVIVDQTLLERQWYVRSFRQRHPDVLPSFAVGANPTTDAYTGDSASANIRWIDHLRDRRPVAFLGELERSFASRYIMVEHGLVLLPTPIGHEPSVEERTRSSLVVLARFRLDSFFRKQDPTSADAEARWRITRMISRLSLLLCEPAAQSITRADAPGLITLGAFLDRYDTLEPLDDPEVLRASGMLHVFNPEFRDAARAVSDLSRYLAVAPPGARAEGARRLLDAVQSATAR